MSKPRVQYFYEDRVHTMLYNALAKQCSWDVLIVATRFAEAVQDVRMMELLTIDAVVMAMDGDEKYNFKRLKSLRRLMKEQGCYIPVLAATAYALPAEHKRFNEAEVDAYLSKPFTAEQLERAEIELMQRFPRDERCRSYP